MKKIFEAVEMEKLTARNRLIRSATWEGIANQDGSIAEDAYAIYEELAEGGVGAIITGFTSVALHDYYFGDLHRKDRLYLSDEAPGGGGRHPVSATGMEEYTMPFIKVHTSCPILPEAEVEIKKRMGRAIELVPGKSEEYLLLSFEDNCRLWLRGRNDAPIAYVEAAIFGNEVHYGYDAFTAEVTRIFSETLGISPENIYLRFEDIPAWGVQGITIDRNRYR